MNDVPGTLPTICLSSLCSFWGVPLFGSRREMDRACLTTSSPTNKQCEDCSSRRRHRLPVSGTAELFTQPFAIGPTKVVPDTLGPARDMR
jgi:hypothetical protein